MNSHSFHFCIGLSLTTAMTVSWSEIADTTQYVSTKVRLLVRKGSRIYCFDLDEISVAEFCAPLINIVYVLYRKSIDVIADRAIFSYRPRGGGGGGGVTPYKYMT